MKPILIALLCLYSLQGLCMNVLVTYFNPFDGRDINNSERVAKEVLASFSDEHIQITLCELPTVYDKAFLEIENCISSMEKRPAMVISLGETGCSGVKIETRALNYDRSFSPDNDGIDRYGTEIYPGEEKSLGVRLPVDKAYCQLSEHQQKGVFISNDAGSFVCNNTLYHSLRNLDIPNTFIHVSKGTCRNNISSLGQMTNTISDLIKSLGQLDLSQEPLPAHKNHVKELLRKDLSPCMRKFYGILVNEY